MWRDCHKLKHSSVLINLIIRDGGEHNLGSFQGAGDDCCVPLGCTVTVSSVILSGYEIVIHILSARGFSLASNLR